MIHLESSELAGKKSWVAGPNINMESLITTPHSPGVYCCIFSKHQVNNMQKLGYKILFECKARNMHDLHKEPSNRLHFIIFEIQKECP